MEEISKQDLKENVVMIRIKKPITTVCPQMNFTTQPAGSGEEK